MTHKLRSLLSVIGVLFGVAAVVAMSSVGEGARREVLAQIGALGIDSISVRVRPEQNETALRIADAGSLASVVPGVLAVAAVREASEQLRVLGRPTPNVLARDEAFGRGRRAPIAGQTGPNERIVREVAAGKQGADPFVEGGFIEIAGRGQEAVGGPLHAIGQGHRNPFQITPALQPPSPGLDFSNPPLGGTAELVANQREGAFNDIGSAGSGSIRIELAVCSRHESPEVADPVQAHEDLSQQPLESSRLASLAQHLDREVGDGGRRLDM